MLHAHLMIRTDDRPLKKAPNAFNAVCMNIAVHPFLFGVIDRTVFGVVVLDAAIANVLISVNVLGTRGRSLMDEIVKLLFINPAKRLDPNRAFAFKGTND